MQRRRTKIVATIGPASGDSSTLREMYLAGMDVVRFNLSHGTQDSYRQYIANLTRGIGPCLQPGRPLALLFDTQGPEIRIRGGALPVRARVGDRVHLAPEGVSGVPGPLGSDPESRSVHLEVSYRDLARDLLGSGDETRAIIGDGNVELTVEEVRPPIVVCRVTSGGTVSPGKKISFPGTLLNLPFLGQEDERDIRFALDCGADYLAISFVRRASDMLEVRELLEAWDADVACMAKIETLEAYQHLDEILEVSDTVMVARGDLGVYCPPEDVPVMQKEIIRKCGDAGVPVVTATQMLESMVDHPVATRAEASDVANAIFDGTDAVMLSAETSSGSYPVEAVRTMAKIAARSEAAAARWHRRAEAPVRQTVTDAVAWATVHTADLLDASGILAPTQSGFTARMVARYRPAQPVVAVVVEEEVGRRLALVSGVYPVSSSPGEDVVKGACSAALDAGLVSAGDLVVVTSGLPRGVPGTTNSMQVHTLGEVLVSGTGIGRGHVTAPAAVGDDPEDLKRVFTPGDVLVASGLGPELVDLAESAGGLVVEAGGLSSPAAVLGLSLGIPVIVGAQAALKRIHQGQLVTVDAGRGLVYLGRAAVR